ncbi:MAG: hypothetical protein H0T73_02685 [Ardenticatenales bacterium]|nr:hypothetical protein [Ardenticatenales bacterium]
MASLLNYITIDEWKTLSDTPVLIGMSIIRSASSGLFGNLKEMWTLGTTLKEEADKLPENELLQGVLKKMAPAKEQGYWDFLKDADVLAVTLESCRTIKDILARKASEQQAREYKQLVLRAGEKTAKASKEGGFLGFGGEHYSEQEKAALAQIAEALGISDWQPEEN